MGGNIPGGNFWVGIFRGEGGIFQWRAWRVGVFRVGIFPEGIFLEPSTMFRNSIVNNF